MIGNYERVQKLRSGGREIHGPFILYWESHFQFDNQGNSHPMQSYTVDYGIRRSRFISLEEADKHIDIMMRRHAVDIAELALGLKRKVDW